MQDRFKFRGKRLDNGQWYYGSYLYLHNAPQYNWNGGKTQTKEDVHYIIDENDVNYGVDPKTVGQCTGLKDTNGKLIYEGDIIKRAYLNPSIEYHTVYFECFYSSFRLDNGECLDKSFAEYYEVIGNIYEQPELLKEQK